MATPLDVFQLFLPPGSIAKGTRPPKPRPGADREADPHVQAYRRINDYGWKVLESIFKDYEAQVTVWKNAFKDVTAAYATAVDQRIRTFGDAEKERASDAAKDGFIFALVTGGAMGLLGAFVQYTVVPLIKIRTANWDFSKGLSSVPGMSVNITERFSKMQAAMFGGVLKDAGSRVAINSYPRPNRQHYPMHLPSVAANLDADFSRLVDESAGVVLKDLRDTQDWMREGIEFGEAWLKHTKGNEERARICIREHLDKLRKEWADSWEFFGLVPRKISRPLLADQYERALWAYFIVQLFDAAIEAVSKSPQLQQTLRVMGKDTAPKLEQLQFLQEDWYHGIGHRKWIEAAIVNRLKEINVVFAETDKGKLDQANRLIDGSPAPEARIFGAVDRGAEIEEICGWADFYLLGVPDQTASRFFPPATRRNLPDLPAYR